MDVPSHVRHGYIRKVRTVSAFSTETSKNQCAVRWQTTKASMTSPLLSRSRARHTRKLELTPLSAREVIPLPEKTALRYRYSRCQKLIASIRYAMGELSPGGVGK